MNVSSTNKDKRGGRQVVIVKKKGDRAGNERFLVQAAGRHAANIPVHMPDEDDPAEIRISQKNPAPNKVSTVSKHW
jgi:hypothetical protein